MTKPKTGQITVLSLGAGVQSTTLLFMAERGEIERPIEAIFADTQWEPKKVYEHVAWLQKNTTIPIHIVTRGNLREDALSGNPEAWIPLYTTSKSGKPTILRRQCTRNYKLRPIRRRIKELKNLYDVRTVKQFIGISTDERLRVKPSGVQYVINSYPLLDLGMSRADCIEWLTKNNYPIPPKSACIGCPFHSNDYWQTLKDRKEEWEDAVEFDEQIRARNLQFDNGVFLHSWQVPLKNLTNTKETESSHDSFLAECEGACGL